MYDSNCLVQTLPASIFRMSNLRLLNVDRNHLVELPKEVNNFLKCYYSVKISNHQNLIYNYFH